MNGAIGGAAAMLKAPARAWSRFCSASMTRFARGASNKGGRVSTYWRCFLLLLDWRQAGRNRRKMGVLATGRVLPETKLQIAERCGV